MPVGRPTKFKVSMCEQVTNYCLLGCTDEELAEFIGISVATLYKWKNKHKRFVEAIKEGKELADARVGNALYSRAIGAEVTEERIINGELVTTSKSLPPDTAACIIWLKNRRREKWNDRKDVKLDADIKTTKLDPSLAELIEAVKDQIKDE